MLPSPLAFPTPVQQAAPGWSSKEPEDADKKRKTPEDSDNAGEAPGSGSGKRLKVDQ